MENGNFQILSSGALKQISGGVSGNVYVECTTRDACFVGGNITFF